MIEKDLLQKEYVTPEAVLVNVAVEAGFAITGEIPDPGEDLWGQEV